jgi:hypothetical protein
MKNKLLLVLGFVIAPVLIEGCCPDARVITLYPGELAVTVSNAANPALTNIETLPLDSLLIRVDFPEATKEREYSQAVNFGSKAYATSCDDTVNSIEVSNIQITANRDYDTSHPVGSELNEIFTGVWYYYISATGSYREPTEMSVYSVAINALNTRAQNNYLGSTNPVSRYYVRPISAPQDNGPYIFTVKISFTDGTTTEKQTEPISIN